MKLASETIKLTQESVEKVTTKARAYLTKFIVAVESEIEHAAKQGHYSCTIYNIDRIPEDIQKEFLKMLATELRSFGYRVEILPDEVEIDWSPVPVDR